jgi:hypothetical protein
MRVNTLIADAFYENVDDVRKFALSQDFGVRGNYPGNRTISFANNGIKNYINDLIRPFAGEITYWSTDEYNGAYQYTTSRDRSWIHSDQTTTWAGIVYLTPDAPLSGGTGLFRHKETGFESTPKLDNGEVNKNLLDVIYKDSQDMTKWELTDRIANKYNRLILYRGDLFHMSLDYFGQDKYDGRLFQTFFFSTEY